MFDFARTLTPGSLLRYGWWKATGKAGPIPVATRSGARFFVRPDLSENNDYGVAYEVFVHDYYRLPPELDPDAIRLVIDLGGNVGMSVLHWLAVLPNCRVEVFEPSPAHTAQMRRNLALSGQSGRVILHPQGAGAHRRTMRFSSLGTSTSSLVTSGETFEAEMVDAFEVLAGKRIDLLKLDVEGGEYELLADPRFPALDLGAVVMEWHTRGNDAADRAWCEDRLKEMGFTIRTIFAAGGNGMFWALRAARGAG